MININQEHLIPLLDVRKYIPVSIPTLRRWTATGKLETVRAGAKVFTSREAVQRMIEPNPQLNHAIPMSVRSKPNIKLNDTLDRLRKKLGDF